MHFKDNFSGSMDGFMSLVMCTSQGLTGISFVCISQGPWIKFESWRGGGGREC